MGLTSQRIGGTSVMLSVPLRSKCQKVSGVSAPPG